MRTAPSALFMELLEARSVTLVPLLTLTTSGGAIYRWSDGPVIFDGNGYDPFLIEVPTFRQSMDNRPSETSYGELYRNYTFTLRNGMVDDTTRLSEVLRADNPQGATIEYRQVIVNKRPNFYTHAHPERQLVRQAVSPDQVTTIFRGTIEKFGPITNESIQFVCTSPQLVGGLETGRLTQGNTSAVGLYSGVGTKHSLVYGSVKKLRCNAVRVGAVTTLASPMASTDTYLTLSDPTGADPAGGLIRVGGEEMSYGSVSGNNLLGLARTPSYSAEHFAGDTVAFIPLSIVFSVGANVSVVDDLWIKNPLTEQLLRITTPYDVTPGDTLSIPGQVFTSVSWTRDTWRLLLDSWIANARVTQQATYESAGGTPVSTDTTTATGTPTKFHDSQRSDDGIWDATITNWTSSEAGSKKLCRQTQGTPANGTRGILRMRPHLQINVLTGGTSVKKALFLLNYKNMTLGIDATTTHDAIAGGVHDFYGAWVNLDPATQTVADLADGVWEYGWHDVDYYNKTEDYNVDINLAEIEYEYIDPADLIAQSSPAAIQAQSGGASVELYADVQGPAAPDADFIEAYAFTDGTGWSPLGGTHTDGGTYQRLTPDVAGPAGGTDLTFDTDAGNWVIQPDSPSATVTDATIASRNCGKWTTVNQGAWVCDAIRTLANLDWSAYTDMTIDVYIPSATPRTQLKFVLGIKNLSKQTVYSFDLSSTASYPSDQWLTIAFSFDDPQSDPHFVQQNTGFDPTNITGIQLEALGQANTILYFSLLAHTGAQTSAALMQKNISATDFSAADDAYQFTVRRNGIVNLGNAVRFSFGNPLVVYPAAPSEELWIVFDPVDLLDDGVITTLTVTAVESPDAMSPPVSVDAVQTIQLFIGINNGFGGSFDVFDLQRADLAANPYSVARGVLLEHPVDVLRHYLTEQLALASTVINDASFTAALTNLGSNKVAAVLTELGADDVTMLKRLGFEHRFQLVQRDTDVGTEYVLLTQQADWTWPAPTVTISEYQEVREETRSLADVFTRRLFLYRRDPSKGADLEAFEQAIEVDPDVNDLSATLPTSMLTAVEAYAGKRLGGIVPLYTIRDDATAKNIAEFWTREELASPSIFTISGVPWTEAYLLERGDIISFQPSYGGAPLDLRVIAVDKPQNEFTTLVCVQVTTS